MTPENYGDITEGTLAWLRMQQGDCVPIMTAILGIAEMGPVDHLRTREEVCEYVESGDVGAARALIQHAKARREMGRQTPSSDSFDRYDD
ncbi:MAG: hypothetical protein ABIZ04_20655 [Opitutus sp.]